MRSEFPSLLRRLVSAGVDFILVGGYAGVVHGCTLLTQEIEICCNFSPGNLLALQKALADLHAVDDEVVRHLVERVLRARAVAEIEDVAGVLHVCQEFEALQPPVVAGGRRAHGR